MSRGRCDYGNFASGAEVAVGPIRLGADVSRGRFGCGADLSDYQNVTN